MPSSTGHAIHKFPLLTLCLALATVFIAGASPAEAGQYKMLMCAGGNGAHSFTTATNTATPQNPNGIFDFANACGQAPADPAGNNSFLRIVENQGGGNAGEGAFGQFVWTAPAFVHFKTAGGYTRQPANFNDGWRARFGGVEFNNQPFLSMIQGRGLPNDGIQWAPSDIFGPHVWPFNIQRDFFRFVFEVVCVRASGCDRSGFNGSDANTLIFTLNDDQDSQVALTNTAGPFLGGAWVRGQQQATWNASDNGSGLRTERVLVDNTAVIDIDWQAHGQCNTGSSGVSGEFARAYSPCPTGGPFARGFPVDTTNLADGPHTLSACTQDYGQFQGLNGTRGQTCASTTIRTDNSAPGAPPGLQVTSANAARYLDRFGAHWNLPPNQGSPIAKVHYEVINAKGEVVRPEQIVSGTDLSQLSGITGPERPGEYKLRLWLEDSVGFTGPAATAPIPRDTTPPAAPQDISVTPPSTTRAADGFDLRWRNVTDAGSPIDAAHYQVLSASGDIVVPARTVSGENVEAIGNLSAPTNRGSYALKLWLSDGEGNVGVPATVPLSYDCVRSEVSSGRRISGGLGKDAEQSEVVKQGEGSLLSGRLTGAGGTAVEGASLCVFSKVVTRQEREFLGLAVTSSAGGFRFAIPPGASRDVNVVYRSDHRELSALATLETIVRPTLKAAKKVVYNKHFARLTGRIPGPDNDNVVVVAQVKRNKGWLAFRRFRTRLNGMYSIFYRFTRTFRRTLYPVRVQVRKTVGYPYKQGNSRLLKLLVLPEPQRG